jgi:hypothetical protein
LALSQRRFFSHRAGFDLFRNTRADRGQINGLTPAPGLHHRGDRRGGIPAGFLIVEMQRWLDLSASHR